MINRNNQGILRSKTELLLKLLVDVLLQLASSALLLSNSSAWSALQTITRWFRTLRWPCTAGIGVSWLHADFLLQLDQRPPL